MVWQRQLKTSEPEQKPSYKNRKLNFTESKIYEYVQAIPVDNILRIDIGLEGDWSSTAVTVWTHHNGLLGFDEIIRSHAINKPSLELYYGNFWLGIHCFQRNGEKNIFDEQLSRELIQFIEFNLKKNTKENPQPRI